MFARFDENPAMTLEDIKETKRDWWTDTRTDGQRENSIPTTNKVCGGYKLSYNKVIKMCPKYQFDLSSDLIVPAPNTDK